ncbi:MAG TPA: hypothetical protein VK499_00140 [Propionibacteriaceae bacterium]|nr:hypothetical protein [Propionibacteriaceae bacterium]
MSNTIVIILVAIMMPFSFPLMSVGGGWDVKKVRFESEEFNDRYTVRTDDPKFASDVIHPRTMEHASGVFIGLRASGDVPATTAINVEEIGRGLHTDETEAARRLFSGLIILPIDSRAAWQAGMWRRNFAARGVTCVKAIAWLPPRPGHTRAPSRQAIRRTSL